MKMGYMVYRKESFLLQLYMNEWLVGCWLISLHANDPWTFCISQHHQEVRRFRAFLCKTFGSLPQAFEAIDANKSGELSLAACLTLEVIGNRNNKTYHHFRF